MLVDASSGRLRRREPTKGGKRKGDFAVGSLKYLWVPIFGLLGRLQTVYLNPLPNRFYIVLPGFSGISNEPIRYWNRAVMSLCSLTSNSK
jgi:hypothetical protein